MFMRRRVAVKVLPPNKAEHPAALGRFYREARAAGSLEHPNVVRTHDIDQDGDLHFIVMEYVDGPNLLEVVKKLGPLDIGRAVHYIHQIALGLDYAYRTGIIHRDIKPGNILIDRHGTAKLLDMGLARFYRDQSDQLTAKYDDKIVLGTADYVAPEQVANSHAVDIRADVYSLGASLYYLLAGHPPFPSGAVSQKLLWHRTKEPTPIRQIRPEVPDELAAVLTRMMAKDPDQRYPTPADVAAALSQWVPTDVPRPSDAEMPRLSPAATETDDYCTPATPLPVSTFAAASAATAVAQPRSVAAGPFAPAARPGPFACAEKPDALVNTALTHPTLSVDVTPLGQAALPESRPAGRSERLGEQYRTIIIVAVAVAVSFTAGILFWKQLGH
jgi:serine/threonine protein kinase